MSAIAQTSSVPGRRSLRLPLLFLLLLGLAGLAATTRSDPDAPAVRSSSSGAQSRAVGGGTIDVPVEHVSPNSIPLENVAITPIPLEELAPSAPPAPPASTPAADSGEPVPSLDTGTEAEAVPAEDCAAFEIENLIFDENRAELAEGQAERLRSELTAEFAAGCTFADGDRRCAPPRFVVDIRGHTDERSTSFPGGNDALSLARAETVAEIVRSLDIDTRDVVGLGSHHQTVESPETRTDEERWADDRRTELVLACRT